MPISPKLGKSATVASEQFLSGNAPVNRFTAEYIESSTNKKIIYTPLKLRLLMLLSVLSGVLLGLVGLGEAFL
jgi:hypothetical protein